MNNTKLTRAKAQYKQISFAIKSFNYLKVSGMFLRNQGRPLVSTVLRLLIPMGGRLNSSWVKVTVFLLKHFYTIAKKQGLPGLVKYLKVCSVCLQQSVAGHYTKDLTSIGPRVGRTKSGLPVCIPVLHRRRIKAKDILVIRFYLTIFSLYRDINYIGKIKLSTITSPFSGSNAIFSYLERFIPRFTKLFAKPTNNKPYKMTIVPKGRLNPRQDLGSFRDSVHTPDALAKLLGEWESRCSDALVGGFEPFPIQKSSPQVNSLKSELSSKPEVVLRSLIVLMKHLQVGTALMTILDRVDYSRAFARFWFRFSKSFHNSGGEKSLPNGWLKKDFIGKLGFKQEAAGKVRVFAMVDPITQWALAPLHSHIFQILRKHVMDGTFDQLRPLSRAWGNKTLHSLDLSAATDRLPIRLQRALISDLLLDPEFAQAWETLLVGREYQVPKNKDTDVTSVTYSVGQPMGALSSWAMLAYTHHFIVQCAAWRVNMSSKSRLYKGYAVLGDDLVIFNSTVAKSYLHIMKELGVECNLSKSVISPKGIGLEFAKKTFLESHDVSPTPLKELYAAFESLPALKSYGDKYNIPFPSLVKLSGAGFRVLGGLDRPLYVQNNLVRMLKLVITVPTSRSEMVELFSSLSLRMKRLGVAKYLDDFIKTYYNEFHRKVWKLNDELEYVYQDSKVNPASPFPEFQEDLYNMTYLPYYERIKKKLSKVLREIEGIKIAWYLGVWRLYQKTLAMEVELSSISIDVLKMDKLESRKSTVARQVRLWRSFSEALKKVHSLNSKGKLEVIPSTELVKSGFGFFIIGEALVRGVLSIPRARVILRKVIIPRIPRAILQRTIKSIVISVVFERLISTLARISRIIWWFVVGIILVIGIIKIDGTDWMWESGVSQATASSLLGLISYYNQDTLHGLDVMASFSENQGSSWMGWYLGNLFLMIFLFLLGTGSLYWYNWNYVTTFTMIYNERIMDILYSGPEMDAWGVTKFLFVSWKNLIVGLTHSVWSHFLFSVDEFLRWWAERVVSEVIGLGELVVNLPDIIISWVIRVVPEVALDTIITVTQFIYHWFGG